MTRCCNLLHLLNTQTQPGDLRYENLVAEQSLRDIILCLLSHTEPFEMGLKRATEDWEGIRSYFTQDKSLSLMLYDIQCICTYIVLWIFLSHFVLLVFATLKTLSIHVIKQGHGATKAALITTGP